MKKLFLVLTLALFVTMLGGCGSEDKVKTLKLAHNLNETHTVHIALELFSKLVNEKTKGSVKIEIYPNGQLGSDEAEELEQLQAGAIAITKVSAAALTSSEEGYNAFALPYVFEDEDHFFNCMNSKAVSDLYTRTKKKGFIGLTFYNSGARSFYTKNKPIRTPADLKGLKIRVMGFPSQTDMVKVLGGTPVSMSYGEVYTSLQSGVIDGAESNETALTTGKHGEVSKAFSLDEHTRIPDILVISSKAWDTLSKDQQTAIKEAAAESTVYHRKIWAAAIEEAKQEATEKMNVTFYEADKASFRKAVQPMLKKYGQKMPEVKKLLDAFKKLEK